MFKRLLVLLALTVPAILRAAEPYSIQAVGPYGTLNNTDRPYAIPSDKAQDLLNVDLTPGGKSVKKRAGYASAFNLAITSSGVHGTYFFYESGGSDVVLVFNDTRLSASIAGASPTVLFSTGPSGATYQCADSAGYAYCNSTARLVTIKTNGTTATNIAVTSTGTMVAVTPERLVTAGFANAPNRIDFSKSNDFETSTPGGEATDPINFTITAPGSRITHIVYAHGRIYWFKDSSFGYILEGPTHADWVARTVNSSVGTIYNTSIFRDDILYFQAQDGHFYGWDGSSLTKLSRDIQQSIGVTQGRTANSWTQTSVSDWNSGAFDNTVFVDTETTSGILTTTFPDTFDVFRTTDSGSKGVWRAPFASVTAGVATPLVSVLDGQLLVHGTDVGGFSPNMGLATFNSINLAAGATFYFDVPSVDSGVTPYFILNTVGTYTSIFTARDSGNRVSFVFNKGVSPCSGSQLKVQNLTIDGTTDGASTCADLPVKMKLWINSSGRINLSANGTTVSESGTATLSSPYYVYFGQSFPVGGTDTGYALDNFTVYPQTFTFQSAVKNASALTSWDSFTATTLNTGGSHTFYIRSATGSFTVNSTTPSYSAIAIGEVPTVSTGSYFQIKDYLAVTSSNTVALYDFTQSWYEGAATDKTYAMYHDNSLWWAVASGAGATTNNKILKFDLLNQGWLIYDIPMGGMYVRNQSLYFGSPTAGTIFKYGDSNNDNGTAISAYWKSRDFFGDSPFLDKDYWRMSTAAYGVVGTNLTIDYTINGSSTTSYTVPLSNGDDTFVKRNIPLPLGTSGTTINIKYSDDSLDNPFEIFGSQIEYTNQKWMPDDN